MENTMIRSRRKISFRWRGGAGFDGHRVRIRRERREMQIDHDFQEREVSQDVNLRVGVWRHVSLQQADRLLLEANLHENLVPVHDFYYFETRNLVPMW
jgi:hypothetical protein